MKDIIKEGIEKSTLDADSEEALIEDILLFTRFLLPFKKLYNANIYNIGLEARR